MGRSKRGPARGHSASVLVGHDQEVLARAQRSACSFCGSSPVSHGDVASGFFVARTDVQRESFLHALNAGYKANWPAWWCESCDGHGIFQPFELPWG